MPFLVDVSEVTGQPGAGGIGFAALRAGEGSRVLFLEQVWIGRHLNPMGNHFFVFRCKVLVGAPMLLPFLVILKIQN